MPAKPMLFAALLCAAVSSPAQQPDAKHLPIGDGKLSTEPKVGYVFSCETRFGQGGMGGGDMPGVEHTKPWVNGDGTFDFADKPTVQGEVAWPKNGFKIETTGEARNIVGNDLPNHTTGVFPIAKSDPAWVYDRNPNSIREQNLMFKLPLNPTAAEKPSCVGQGPIGFMLSGVYLFNALDAGGRDAVAHEVQDHCHGHPAPQGSYHYHNLTNCLADPGTGHSNLLGYALDGYGIYGTRGEGGKVLHNSDLDACHGHTHEIEWDGKKVVMYHYHATMEYPYVVACYHGTPEKRRMGPPPGGGGQRGPGAGGMGPPPGMPGE